MAIQFNFIDLYWFMKRCKSHLNDFLIIKVGSDHLIKYFCKKTKRLFLAKMKFFLNVEGLNSLKLLQTEPIVEIIFIWKWDRIN